MTAAQASAAFAAHAVGFPATHVRVIVPPAPGVIPPSAAALLNGHLKQLHMNSWQN